MCVLHSQSEENISAAAELSSMVGLFVHVATGSEICVSRIVWRSS